MVDELDDGVFEMSSLDGVADMPDAARPIVDTLDGVPVSGRAHEALPGLHLRGDEVPDETCACRCGCQHPVGRHGPATCQDCRHGRHRGGERRAHRWDSLGS